MAPVSEYKKYVSVGDTGMGTLSDGGCADLLQVLVNEEGEVEDIAARGWWDWYKRPYKKRPGAPKGRLRSPKVNRPSLRSLRLQVVTLVASGSPVSPGAC